MQRPKLYSAVKRDQLVVLQHWLDRETASKAENGTYSASVSLDRLVIPYNLIDLAGIDVEREG